MACEGLKLNQSNELQEMKTNLDQLKDELSMTQTMYHQRFSDYQSKLEQLHGQVEKVRQEQEEKEANLLNAMAEWRDMKAKLESSAMSPDQKVKLNVGGKYFQTTMETLTKHSEGTLSYFKALLSRQWQLARDPKDESIFIDRDGDLFEYILQYLRTGVVPIDPDNNLLRRDLTIEANFYKIDTLVDILNQNSSKKEQLPKVTQPKSSKTFYTDSSILSLTDQFELNKLSEFDNQQWQLIYRASRNGYTAKAFHEFCDGCFPTMCVIRSNNGFIFGGFTSIPWSSKHKAYTDTSAFLFTLKNPHGIKPTKYSVQERSINCAITHNPNAGPTFGSGQRGGVDLSLHNPFNGQEN